MSPFFTTNFPPFSFPIVLTNCPFLFTTNFTFFHWKFSLFYYKCSHFFHYQFSPFHFQFSLLFNTNCPLFPTTIFPLSIFTTNCPIFTTNCLNKLFPFSLLIFPFPIPIILFFQLLYQISFIFTSKFPVFFSTTNFPWGPKNDEAIYRQN